MNDGRASTAARCRDEGQDLHLIFAQRHGLCRSHRSGAQDARIRDAVDREEIYAFEDWWKRIEALIGRADTVVFVLSPDAVKSEVALKEIADAASLNKRFAPIVWRRVEDTSVPEPLRRLNFIFFDDPARFDDDADKLVNALQTDIGWIRQHTEYGEAERRWSAAGRPRGLLLHSPTLDVAEYWIASRPAGAPEPTQEIQAFVTACRQGARAAQRLRRLVQASISRFWSGSFSASSAGSTKIISRSRSTGCSS